MLSTPDGDSAGPPRHHQRRCRCASSTSSARTIHRRRRTPAHTLTRRTGFSSRPTTLWPFAGADPLPGTAQLAGWLGRVIVTLVTGHTRPGDRVLLLTPPTFSRRRSPLRGTREPDPYAGMGEAVWTVIRLGRDVEIATAAPSPAYPRNPTDSPPRHAVESASGLRLRQPNPRTPTHHSAPDDRESGSRAVSVEDRHGDRFDLIVAAVHPHDTDWLAHTDWSAILTATGTIAAITHSDSSGCRLTDPTPAIAGTFRSRDWRWLDHIAVLTEHLQAPATAMAATTSVAVPTATPATAPTAERLPIRAAHHDLMLFAAAPPKDQATRQALAGDIG